MRTACKPKNIITSYFVLTWGVMTCPSPACRPGPTLTTTPLSALFSCDSVRDSLYRR